MQQLLADAGARQWDKAVDRTTALSTYTNVQLEALPHDQAVVAYDTNGDIADIGADPEQSARLQVDGWPIYADDPWARFVDLADDVDFQRQVAVNDRTKLPTK